MSVREVASNDARTLCPTKQKETHGGKARKDLEFY